MTEAIIELRRVEPVTVMTLCAGKANAFDLTLLDALTRTIDRVVADGAQALVITGTGNALSGGLALPSLIDLDRAGVRTLITAFGTAMRRVLEAPIPVIAGINGNAIAGGCVLALMCAERIMLSHGAKGPPKIGLNEAQLGLGLPAIVLELVRHRVPATSHVRVMLEGRLFEPTEALAIGLVDAVIAPDQFEAHALARSTVLASSERTAFAQIKRAMLRPAIEAITRTDADETEAWLDTWFSDESQRRMRATVARITKK
ncbi:enoyl-CoA hydratase/isomerase family protein [soil metagenome]